MRAGLWMIVVAVLLVPALAGAELAVPPGFTVQAYVTGEGFDADASRGVSGVPSMSTLAFDHAGNLYLARTGRRYSGGEVEDIWPIYRIPPGGARLTPKTEAGYFHGPPLPNPQVGVIRDGRELFVTTFDRDRRVGVLYRLVDGRIELVAGGTPDRGAAPVLKQPEGVAVDPARNLYVADREQGVILRLDAAGHVVDPGYVTIRRPRVLTADDAGGLWIGSDAGAEAPWQTGPGEIWQVSAQGAARLVLRGPVPQAISLSSGGHLFVADRQGAQVFAVTAEGTRIDFARFTGGDAPRSLVFAPVTPDTRRAGIAGDLFVVAIKRGAWPVNEILRISGPFDDLVRERLTRGP